MCGSVSLITDTYLRLPHFLSLDCRKSCPGPCPWTGSDVKENHITEIPGSSSILLSENKEGVWGMSLIDARRKKTTLSING